jgi:hypothetical protein
VWAEVTGVAKARWIIDAGGIGQCDDGADTRHGQQAPAHRAGSHGLEHHPMQHVALVTVRAREEEFDLVMLTAVWMHLDEVRRQQAMPNVSALVRDGGIVIMSLRHRPIPPGRRMFEVSAKETIALARRSNLSCAH